jgi:hypothetical protein
MALNSQDACNLSGLAHSLANELLPKIWEEAKACNRGTDYVNSHPTIRLFLEQMLWLNGREYQEAYNLCHIRADLEQCQEAACTK